MSATLGTRAVLRKLEPGDWTRPCAGCHAEIRFRGKKRPSWQIIANVYHGIGNGLAIWDRVEHWHEACYLAAGEPYGKAEG